MVFAFVLWGGSSLLISGNQGITYAGAINGKKVSYKEYEDMYRLVGLFADPRLPHQETPEGQAWFHLVLKREAEKKKITTNDAEVKDQIQKLFPSGQFSPENYTYWVKNVTGVSPRNFEEMIRQMVCIQKLTNQIYSEPVTVDDYEIRDKYLDENNSLDAEFAQYDSEEAAKKAYEELNKPEAWAAAKEKDPKFATPTGFISLEALNKLWLVPREQVYSLLKLEIGQISTPVKSQKGFALYHILNKRIVSEKDMDEKTKDLYRQKASETKKLFRIKKWSEDLFRQANVKKFSE